MKSSRDSTHHNERMKRRHTVLAAVVWPSTPRLAPAAANADAGVC